MWWWSDWRPLAVTELYKTKGMGRRQEAHRSRTLDHLPFAEEKMRKRRADGREPHREQC